MILNLKETGNQMKFKFNSSIIKRCVIYGLCLLVLLLGVVGSYTYIVISDLKQKLELKNLKAQSSELFESRLEKESIVNARDFDFFVTFLKTKYDQENQNKLNKVGGSYLILEDFSLSAPYPNECDRYRCLQSRINFDNIPSNLWKGLMGVEDFRFLNHQGVDPISIARAIIVDIKAMSFVQGGSTLTQQLAKNLFLTNEKKFQRKIQEMIYALYLERTFSKDQIITMYFNEVFWGVVGGVSLKGINMASLVYFDKQPELLTPFESAILIGMLKGPGFYSPEKHLDRLKSRVDVVMNRLESLSLYQKNSDRWSDQEWEEWQKKIIDYRDSNLILSLYRTVSNGEQGLEPFEKFTFNRAVVYTFKNLKDRIKGLDIAVKSMVTDISCDTTDCKNTFSYYTKFERDKLRAIKSEKHQVGSILKPLIYQEFLGFGKTLQDTVSTDKITLKLLSGDWTPSDSHEEEKKEVTLKYAIQTSMNRPLIRTAKEVGFDNLEKSLKNYFPELLTPLSEYPAQLLGAIELSLDDVTRSYLKFFNTQCENVKLGVIEFEETLIYALAQAQQTTIRRAANKILKNSMIFGKTGTTNNGLDNWYIASDGEKFFVTWFGVDSARENKELRLYGSNSAFKIFQYFISYRGKQIRDFYCL